MKQDNDEPEDEDEMDEMDETDEETENESVLLPGAPNPQPAAPTVSYEHARRRLIERYGYKDDELDTLFSSSGGIDEAKLVEFYNKTLTQGLNRKSKEVDDSLGWDSDDSFDLSETEKRQREATKDQKAIEQFAQRDQSGFDKDARLSPEELNETRKSINELLQEEI